jgi:hypothetical protein
MKKFLKIERDLEPRGTKRAKRGYARCENWNTRFAAFQKA